MLKKKPIEQTEPAPVAPGRVAKSRVAVVGCGYWGKNLVRSFSQLDALAAVCDPDPVITGAHSKEYGAPARAWAELLEDKSVAGVAIAAPAALHANLTRDALLAGKDVFVEKPLALHSREAEELCNLAESRGRILMVGHLLQYHPAFLKLKEMVNKGELGRLQYIYSNRLNLGKVRREENILWSFAPHDISMILSLAGEQPNSVKAAGAAYLHKVIADVTTTHLSFPSGVQAHVFVSWLHPYKEQKLVVVGDRAMAVFDDGEPWDRKLLTYPHRIDWIDGHPQPSKANSVAVAVESDEPLKLECRHFIECMATRQTPRTDGREGLRVLQVLQTAESSMAVGQSLSIASPRPAAPAAGSEKSDNDVFVHESAIVDEPGTIGSGTKIWHFSHILKNVDIGKNCVIGQNVMIGPDVSVGNGCKIQNNVSLYKGLTLEEGVFRGPSCVFTNVNTPRAQVERKDEFLPTRVKRGATIGANATIVCGHTLGEYCFIAAGAVVTKDVPAYALMAGNPARRMGWVSSAGERLSGDLVCPRTGQRYRETKTGEIEEIKE